ncbi:semaphorin 5c [Bemisia tabaci]|uniref:semaphorin 5c n=1 Tax=Bemisia tabaci TaxID=7038 RepID=UPI003B28147B
MRFLFLLSALGPLVSFSGSDSQVIAYEDLLNTAREFFEPGVTSFTQILFDVARKQLIVGARDVLFRLTLDDLTPLERTSWKAQTGAVDMCLIKGQSEADCHNFIKVLLSTGKKLFACGTNAFQPHCSWRELESLNRVTDWPHGVAKCPHSPHANITALMTAGGQYFVGTPTNFAGADYAIIRDAGANLPYLRTQQYDNRWLNEPHFVGSFETEDFVYFLFREIAVEYMNCGKAIYSRVARVCKNDPGGKTMLKENWTTFVKARLNCSIPGEYPFYYNEIQGMTYFADTGMVYATFTTPRNSIPGSAICAFNLTAINAAFNGPFKYQSSVGSAWEKIPNTGGLFAQCQRNKAEQTEQSLSDALKYRLMDSAVQPTTLHPLYSSQLETLTHIAMDVVPTKSNREHYVLYVATLEGLVKKISILPGTRQTCVLEVWKPFPNDVIPKIHTLHYLKETDSVYIGTEEKLIRIPAERCSRHKTREACEGAMDPYCGWSEHQEQCQPPPNRDPLFMYWYQNATMCPVTTHSVPGGWSSWSNWSVCSHMNTNNDSSDSCLCSTRRCDNPAPQNGGAPCEGPSIRVTNCTVHGEWTPWSAWSACSQTCGMAIKTRRRYCGNPAPAFGGRVCVGPDTQELYCHTNPPCPAITPPVQNGGWSSWGSWSECSARCGGGFRVRHRQCNDPPPQKPGGLDCPGNSEEYEECNTMPCQELKRSSWTQWMPVGNRSEKRFRYKCRAPVSDPTFIKIILDKEEERLCDGGACHRTNPRDRGEMEEEWSEWSNWSECSAECGGGTQFRTRSCEGRDCPGSPQMSRTCNTQPCKGEWGCWTDWSECSVSCGTGFRERTRVCLAAHNRHEETTGCEGSAAEQQSCEMPPCDGSTGWSSWSTWSTCDENGQQFRTRKCLGAQDSSDFCDGRDTEIRDCPDLSNDISPMRVQSSSVGHSVSVASILGFCVLAFAFGLIVSGFLCYYWLRRQRPIIPGSPHYISSKQNPYVTVPLKEVHHPKRTPSFSKHTLPSNGTPKVFNSRPVEYETATIKRNSHSLLNGHRQQQLDLEQEKFF